MKTRAAIALGRSRYEHQLNEALGSRKVIGQAIGLVMEHYQIDEDRAFHFLVRVSRNSNIKLREAVGGVPAGTSRPRTRAQAGAHAIAWRMSRRQRGTGGREGQSAKGVRQRLRTGSHHSEPDCAARSREGLVGGPGGKVADPAADPRGDLDDYGACGLVQLRAFVGAGQ